MERKENIYETPKIEVLEVEIEQAVLSGASDFNPQEGDGM